MAQFLSDDKIKLDISMMRKNLSDALEQVSKPEPDYHAILSHITRLCFRANRLKADLDTVVADDLNKTFYRNN